MIISHRMPSRRLSALLASAALVAGAASATSAAASVDNYRPGRVTTWIKGSSGGASPACPYSATAIIDGCSGANPNSEFLVSAVYGVSFYQHAAQSGQTWYAPHPWTYNSPGVDYPVGRDKTTVLKDPANIGSDASASGCTWYPTGTLGYVHAEIYCSLGNPDITIAGYDLSLYGGVYTRIGSAPGSGTFYYLNNKWVNGAGLDSASAPKALEAGVTSMNNVMVVKYNSFDGATRNGFHNLNNVVSCAHNCDIEYNYAKDIPHQLFNTGGLSSTVTVARNYVEGLGNDNCGGGACLHGAVLQNINSTAGSDYGSQWEFYNTVVFETGHLASQNTTSFSQLGNSFGGVYNQQISDVRVDHNVVVANCAATYTNAQGCPTSGGYETVGQALSKAFDLTLISSYLATDNVIDPHGAADCFGTGGTESITGGSISADGAGAGAGFVLNITAYSNSSTRPIVFAPGMYITSSSHTELSPFSHAADTMYYIMPYGTNCGGVATTGTGGLGTYCLASPSGPAINVSLSTGSNGTANVPINPIPGKPMNATIARNIDLKDGSTIDPGQYWGGPGLGCNGRAGTTL